MIAFSGRRGPASALTRTLLLPAVLWAFASLAPAEVREAPVPAESPPAAPPAAAVATAHPLATQAALDILAAGGNAFDAAVAASAALAVVEPQGSGLGGGGFWLLHRAATGLATLVDGRERAPLAARRDMYLDAAGEPIPGLSLNGPLAAGIPGAPAALAQIAEGYGRLGLARDLGPAIRLAREGFAVDPLYSARAALRAETLRAAPAAAAQFLADEGAVPPPGWRLVQPDLARTLETLAADGPDGFYRGPLAERLVEGVRAAGGIWTLEDLAEYRAVERAPLVGTYRGLRVVSAPPPSAGGVLVVAMLNMLEAIETPEPQVPVANASPLASAPSPAAARVHARVEAMRRAYRDRALYLGDPDRVDMPLARLTHPFYAAGLIRDFHPRRATPSLSLGLPQGRPDCPHDAGPREGASTTHLSILDAQGNRVAATLSINTPFGSGFVPPGTGVLLNNEMDDFSLRPGIPNAYGLVGGEANAVAPGKRMLSSMSPTFLESDTVIAVLGTPGGSRIPTMVLNGILAIADGVPLEDWIARPRFHHQYLPDAIELEPGALDPSVMGELKAMGHCLEVLERPFGNLQAIVWDRADGRVQAASDPRGSGRAALVPAPPSR